MSIIVSIPRTTASYQTAFQKIDKQSKRRKSCKQTEDLHSRLLQSDNQMPFMHFRSTYAFPLKRTVVPKTIAVQYVHFSNRNPLNPRLFWLDTTPDSAPHKICKVSTSSQYKQSNHQKSTVRKLIRKIGNGFDMQMRLKIDG